jgi:hypothetical protein
MKKLWEKFKLWLNGLWLKFIPWLILNWAIIANYIVILVAYSSIYGKPNLEFAEFLLGLWIVVSAGYGIFKLFMKKK